MIRSSYIAFILLLLLPAAAAQTTPGSSSSQPPLEFKYGDGDKDWKDRVQVGSPITVRAGETRGDIVCIACPVQIKGSTKDVVVLFGFTDIDGSVRGDVVVLGAGARLGPHANISGDLVVTGALQRDADARVGGEVVHSPIPLGGGILVGLFLAGLAFTPVALAAALICYAVAGERRVANVAAAVARKPAMALAAGAGVLVAAVALIFLFQRMHPLTPWLVCAEAAGFIAALVLGYTGLSSWMGRMVNIRGPLAAVLIGGLMIVVAQAIPFLGAIVFLVFMLLALGCTALSGYGTAPDWLETRMGNPPRPISTGSTPQA